MNAVKSIGFGTARLHHCKNKKSMYNILDFAYNSGIRHFDTSPYYGCGMNEFVLFDWIYKNNIRDEITFTTKFGLYPPFNFYSKNKFSTIFSKSLTKILNKKYRILADSNFAVKRITFIEEKFGFYPDYYFLHEPLLFFDNLDIENFIIDIQSKYNTKSKNISFGLSGNLDKILKKSNYSNVIIQRPLHEGLADFNFSCLDFSSKNIFSLLNRFNNSKNHSTIFLFSSKKKNNILEFVNYFNNG